MASSSVDPQNLASSLSNDDMESFVILGTSTEPGFESLSIEDEEEQKAKSIIENAIKLVAQKMDSSTVLPEMPEVKCSIDKDLNEQTISISTVSSELIPEDIQGKINEVIEENTQLKKTILDNNNSFKSQRDRILTWQKDVMKILDENKKQFIDAKQCIECLKQENANLHQELELQKQKSDENLLKKNKQDMLKPENNIVELEDKLRQEKERQIHAASNDKNLQEALMQIEKFSNEQTKLLAENEALQKKIVDLTSENDIKANSKIDELTKKNIQLEYDYNKSQDLLKAMNKEINSKIATINLLNLELDTSQSRVKELTNLLEEANQKNQGAVTTVAVEDYLNNIKVLNGKLDSSTKYIDQLKSENKNLSQLIVSTNEQLANVQHQLMSIQLKARELTDLKAHLEQQIFANGEEKKVLEEKINVFQIQLDYYKNDFETERTAKETLKEERDQLAEDLGNIQRRNRELQEEIELIRENEYVVPRRTSRSSPATSAHSNSSQYANYSCPICNVKFRSIKLLEEHVETCPHY